MTHQRHEDAWLSTVLPTHLPAQAQHSCEALELHKRLVHLATLREAALAQLGQLDAVKVALTEKKSVQQGRLLAALEARLSAALAKVDPHRCAAWDLVKALEKEAAHYSSILQGLQQSPPVEKWAALTERYQQLQHQVHQQQQSLKPSELQESLSAGMEPCQVDHVQVVEQLRAEVDSLKQQLHHAKVSQKQAAQAAEQEAVLCRAQQTEEQQAGCIQELAAMQQLATLVIQQLDLYHSMQTTRQQQHPVGTASTQLPQQRHQACSIATPVALGNSSTNLQAQCQKLKQQLQQLSDAADQLMQGSLLVGSSGKGHTAQPAQHDSLAPELMLCLNDPLDGCSLGTTTNGCQSSSSQAALQQDSAAVDSQPGLLHGMSVRLHHGMAQYGSSSSSSSSSGQGQEQLQVVRLRLTYQQMLHKVQARYQQDLQRAEARHQESLRAQAQTHQQALADLAQQHQEVCGRLAAAARADVDMQQQVARLNADNRALQQQIERLQRELGAAAAGALAVAQVQHEQQMLAAKQEQQQLLQEARQQVEQLQQQLRELQEHVLQQQPAALPLAEAVAALVAEATAKQSAQQLEQLQQLEAGYKTALQQREEQHLNLLSELAALKQLQEEPSNLSSVSDMEAPTSAATAPTEAAVAPFSHHGVAAAGVGKMGDSCCNGQALPAANQQQAAAPCSAQAAVCDEVLHPQLHAPCDAGRSGDAPAARHNPMQASSAHAGSQLSTPAQQWCEQQHEPLQDSQQQQQQAAQQSGQQHQQQQQQPGQAPEDDDAMGALIAAVLGCGPRGRAQLARHQERMEQQQQQHQVCVQSQAPVPKQQPAPANPADLQAELDNLLGLSPTRGGQAAVTRSRADAELLAASYSGRELAPANAELAAAVERARVARTCPSALQDISCSSACNPSAGKLGGRGSSSSSMQEKDSRPPWKPSSPRLSSAQGQSQQQQQQRQDWKQWQQSPAPASSGSPSKGRARTPSPAGHHGRQAQQQQQQQQQAPELPVLACVRCGQQEGDNMGPCCFHPGLVAAPGPLMYGQEWHACRARCTPDMPGCYTRKEHFFTPILDSHGRGKAVGDAATQPADSCKAVACRSAGAMRQRPIGSPSRLSPHPNGTKSGCTSPRVATAWAASSGASAGRQGAKWGSAAASPHEPKPRSTLPKPSLCRG